MANAELKNRIKEFRSMKSITQEELGSKIQVTRKTINTIENAKFVPSVILAIRLARYFKVPVEELFELDEK
jgi:putative transcriptional regulator